MGATSRGVTDVAWWMRRSASASALVVVLTAATLVVLGVRAGGADPDRCDRFAADSRARAGLDTSGTGGAERVVVIGDSWSAGLGLDPISDSWPSRLPGTVHVAGFSGSGFTEGAGSCPGVSFADRAPAAVRDGADLVVVEGGLNDVGESDDDLRAGFARLLQALEGYDVVVVGPASAPSRAAGVPRVDALLADLAAAYDVAYVRTAGLALPYLDDQLHLTAAGHAAFGDYVAARVAVIG